MKVLLVNPPVRTWAKPNAPPLGLLYVAAALTKHGHEVEIYDINALRCGDHSVRDVLQNCVYDWVGIGGIITTFAEVREIATICHYAHPGKPIIVGGPVGSSVPRLILEKTCADGVCMGEGEHVAVDFCRSLETDHLPVSGMSYRAGGQNWVSKAPAPMYDLDAYRINRDLVPMDIYLKNPIGATNKRKWVDGGSEEKVCNTVLLSSRGCPYRCTYCAHNYQGYSFRQREPGRVVEEMALLQERYGCTYLHFADDLFMANPRWIREFCDLLGKTLQIEWGCTGRVNIATEDLLLRMKDAGCVQVAYGVESGSQTILDAIKKGTTVAQAENALKLSRRIIGPNTFSMMMGFPEDTDRTLEESVEFCQRVGEKPEAIFFATPYPGTELYEYAKSQGAIEDEERYILGLGEQGQDIACNLSIWDDDVLRAKRDRMLGRMP